MKLTCFRNVFACFRKDAKHLRLRKHVFAYTEIWRYDSTENAATETRVNVMYPLRETCGCRHVSATVLRVYVKFPFTDSWNFVLWICWGFDFWPHSIIPVTWNSGVPRLETGAQHKTILTCLYFFFKRKFFYPKGSMAKTKVESFVAFLNVANQYDFFKRFSVRLTSSQLDAILEELENAVEITDTIPRAVSIVGRNIQSDNQEIWALNSDLFIDAKGRQVEQPHLRWISHLVAGDPGNRLADEKRSAEVHLPLSKYYFDLVCHLLRGDILTAVENDDTLSRSLDVVLRDAGINRDSITANFEAEENGNFLASFYTIAMSLIMVHYDKVSDNFKQLSWIIHVKYFSISDLLRSPVLFFIKICKTKRE